MPTENELLRQINGLKQLIAMDSEMIRVAVAGNDSNKKVLSILKTQLVNIRDKALYGNGMSFKDSLIDVYDPDSHVIYPSILEYRNRYYKAFEDAINGIKPRIGKVYTKKTVQIVPNGFDLGAKLSSPTGGDITDTYYKLPSFNISHNCSNATMDRFANILDTEIIDNLPKIPKLEIPIFLLPGYAKSLSNHNNCSCIVSNDEYSYYRKLFVFEAGGIYIYKPYTDIYWTMQEICGREDLYTMLIRFRKRGEFNYREVKEYK